MDTTTRSGSSTTSKVSISPTCRHRESGVGAAPNCSQYEQSYLRQDTYADFSEMTQSGN